MMFHYLIVFLLLVKEALLARTPMSAKGKAIMHPFSGPAEAISLHPAAGGSSQGSTLARPYEDPHYNPYKQFKGLADLVENRPQRTSKTSKKIKQYNEAFSDHPDVPSIKLDNLDYEGMLRFARETLKLRDPNQRPTWQRRLTLSLQSHLMNANIDEKTRNNILGVHVEARIVKSSRKARLAEKGDIHASIRKKERQKQYYAEKKELKNSVQRRNYAFAKDLDDLIGSQRLKSCLEVASKAEALRGKYPDEKDFLSALRAYLMKKKYHTDEIALVRGSHVMDREMKRVAKVNAQRLAHKKKAASAPIADRLHDEGTS